MNQSEKYLAFTDDSFMALMRRMRQSVGKHIDKKISEIPVIDGPETELKPGEVRVEKIITKRRLI